MSMDLRTLWTDFLNQKDQSTEWQKALLKMLALDNLPDDLRLDIGKVVLQEAPSMPAGMRQDAYSLVYWLVPDLAVQAWTSAQEIGLTRADLRFSLFTHGIKTAIDTDDAKKLIADTRAEVTRISRSIRKRVQDALKTSPFHDVLNQMKEL